MKLKLKTSIQIINNEKKSETIENVTTKHN